MYLEQGKSFRITSQGSSIRSDKNPGMTWYCDDGDIKWQYC